MDHPIMTPRATYRLQFHGDFTFRDAANIAPYLARLGVSHVYASSWLKARPGSTHGYDIVDHHTLNTELGTAEDFEAMVAAFRANGLRQILDYVPNHMGVGGSDNPLWLDVLEWGPDSAYAGWFDIDWRPDRTYLRRKLLVPFLGDQYGVELHAGKFELRFDEQEGSFAVWVYGVHKLPICPLYYSSILGSDHIKLERLGDDFDHLPEWRPQVGRRARDLKDELARAAADPEVDTALEARVGRFKGTPGDEASWHALHELIQEQYWRAADFRVAADDINYRRFFNINELAGLRMELPEVFEHTHSLPLQLLSDHTLDGLRIDHVDGLLNPKEYFQRLRAHASNGAPFYLVVEKILARHESLRDDWPVDGTTGYEFANLVLGLLIDPASEEAFTTTYTQWAGERKPFSEVVRDSKLRIMRYEMAGELDVLAREAARVARQNPRTADFTTNVLRRAIRELIACFPVYRIYLDLEGTPTEEDRRDLNWAMKRARAAESSIDPSVFDFLHRLLSGDLVAQSHSGFSRQAALRCAMKAQQYSGPVMAKGLEDTAFYRYNRFVALNEVGGDPDQFGISISSFHKANAHRAKRWPRSMLTTSTHDTKHGEDVRARLAVLAEMPQEWGTQVAGWSRILRARRSDIEAAAPPDRNDEYLLYQLLVGTWPAELTGYGSGLNVAALSAYADRLKGTMVKSLREAKVHSTWATPNPAYEDAVLAFIDSALDAQESGAFFSAFLPFQERVARLGVENSLVQTALKLTAPGVPDLYQGSELWDLSLVDPDNRRPVDYQRRRCLLEHDPPPMRDLLERWHDGAIKLWLTTCILRFRQSDPELFALGEYRSLTTSGSKGDCICAFERHYDGRSVVVAAARFPARRAAEPDWADTVIAVPPHLDGLRLRDVLTGAAVSVGSGQIDAADAFRELPVAVLRYSE
jgi:(1->4)-alpha-D-glucan 1-alpha-D-glucosylmutase